MLAVGGAGIKIPEWKMGENTLDAACVFERRVVVAREKVKEKVDWRAKQNASDANPDGAAPVPRPEQESGEGWKEKQARLAEERKKKQEEEAKVKEAEIDDIDIGGTSSDDEADAAAA